MIRFVEKKKYYLRFRFVPLVRPLPLCVPGPPRHSSHLCAREGLYRAYGLWTASLWSGPVFCKAPTNPKQDKQNEELNRLWLKKSKNVSTHSVTVHRGFIFQGFHTFPRNIYWLAFKLLSDFRGSIRSWGKEKRKSYAKELHEELLKQNTKVSHTGFFGVNLKWFTGWAISRRVVSSYFNKVMGVWF